MAELYSSDQSDHQLREIRLHFSKSLIMVQLSHHKPVSPLQPLHCSLNTLPPIKGRGRLGFSPQLLISCELVHISMVKLQLQFIQLIKIDVCYCSRCATAHPYLAYVPLDQGR